MVNQISSIPSTIKNLKDLRWLNLGFNPLKRICDEVFSLTNLELLSFTNTQITRIPPAIGSLQELILLDISANELTSLPSSICGLSELSAFYLNNNRLRNIPPDIGKLRDLSYLYLHENDLQDLPDSLSELPNLSVLTLHKNNALDIPLEILGPEFRKTGDSNPPANPQDILHFYISRRGGTQRPLNEVKVLVVGEGGVGKTSLIKQLRGEIYNPDENKTHGIERHKVTMECGQIGPVQLNIWDFGGQDIMHATHEFFMTHRSVYLLVLDSRQNERQTRIDYWLRLIGSYGANSPVIVVCNKSDQQVMQLNWTALQREYPQVKAFSKEVCCYHSEEKNLRKGLDELKNHISSAIENFVPEVNRLIPTTWINVKNELENDGRDYLTLEEFHSLAESKGIDDNRDRQVLLSLLHQLGSVFHFSEHSIFDRDRTNNSAPSHIEELNVLDPGWVTTAIYKILNDPVLIRGGGILDRGSLRRSLNELPKGSVRYPKNKDDFIIAMMRRFEICFAFDGSHETWLLPDLLHEDEIDTGDWTKGIAFRYQYRVLPASVIGRLMVRLHTLINRKFVWRTGALFAQGACETLVRSDPETAYIDILVRGGTPQERRAMLALIRGTLAAIHQSFSDKLGEKEQIPVHGHPGVFLNYQKLLLLEAEGEDFEREIVDGKLVKISVAETLNGVTERTARDDDRANLLENPWPNMVVHGNVYQTTGKSMTNNYSNINISGNVSNSQIGQTLTNCKNIVSQQAEGDKKELLESITKETEAIIAALPPEKQGEAPQITNSLEQLVKQATSENPNKAWYEISATGLLEAATWIKDYSGKIIPAVKDLGNLLGMNN